MALSAGTRIGPYQIDSAVGAGGMGEVYRARDSRLGRDVAIKILPPSFTADPDRLRRFQQEARTVATLSHPNVLALFDTGDYNGAPYLVSELLEGETLRDRLRGGALSSRRAIEYASEIADGLAAAHDKGIVHRDLKPENIFLTKDGRVKILDFGLAKLTRTDAQLAAAAEGVTTAGATHTTPGLIVGTAGYMSPEQVRGKEVDGRTDVFSLGAIFYEMLSGRRAFRGETSVETMNSILRDDPPELDTAALQVSPGLERIVRHCLEKEPQQRFQSARDVKFAIEALSGSTSNAAQLRLGTRRFPWWWAAIAAAVLIAVAAVAIAVVRNASPAVHAMRFAIPAHGEVGDLAISRDGTMLAFVSPDENSGKPLLFVQRIGDDKTNALLGTEGAAFPFWSPDNEYIGFFAAGKLMKIHVSGGPPQPLASVSRSPRGGAWSSKGVIVYSVQAGGYLWRINADGTGVAPLTDKIFVEPNEASHRWPVFLPDGDHFLFLATGIPNDHNGIYLSSLSRGEKKLILYAQSNPGLTQRGLFYTDTAGHLFTQAFDAAKGLVRGDTRTVVEQVGYNPSIFLGAFSVAENGTVVSNASSAASRSILTWYDRTGKELGTVGSPGIYYNPALSPDGQSLAYDVADLQTASVNVWISDTHQGTTTRFTFGRTEDVAAVWSPDGSKIAYRSFETGVTVKAANGLEKERQVARRVGAGDIMPNSWTPDRRSLICTVQQGGSSAQLYLIGLDGGKMAQLIPGHANSSHGQISPDGKWLVYASDESGSWEIYVTTFPGVQGKWQLSQGGGTEPRWRGDGKEVFYISAKGNMVAVPISTDSGFASGPAQELFPVHSRAPISSTDFYSYAVTKDGQRFIVNKYQKPANVLPLDIVLNATK